MNRIALNNGRMRKMFDAVPEKYNRLNKILTFGQDETWRQKALDAIEAEDGTAILDLCTGTGDLALKIAGRFPNARVYALDFSPRMLAWAKERAQQLNVQNIIFKENDCLGMTFPDEHFDYITISFGFRNLSYSTTNLDKALKEINRVLKNGGRLVIIETSQPINTFVRRLFHFYAIKIVPRIGMLLSGKKEPYAYLGMSIVKFFDSNKLVCFLGSRGFKLEKRAPYMFGMISLYVFQKK